MTFHKLQDEEYFKIKALSSHGVMSFFFPQQNFNNHKALELGTYIHAKVLENPEDAADIVAKKCQKLEKSDMDKMEVLIDRLAANPEITAKMPVRMVVPGTLTEVMASTTYTNKKGTVIPIKGKFDLINTVDKYVLDLKTTSDLKNFEDSVYKYAYHIQAAFYLRLANMVTGTNDYKDFYWSIVDKKSQATKLMKVTDEMLKVGNDYVDLYLENPPSFMSW